MLKHKSASERCPDLVDVGRAAGVSVGSSSGGLKKPALVEALLGTLSPPTSASAEDFVRTIGEQAENGV